MYKKIGNVVWKVNEENNKSVFEKILEINFKTMMKIHANKGLVPEKAKITEEEEQKLRYIPGKK